jgi:hypothetical protein
MFENSIILLICHRRKRLNLIYKKRALLIPFLASKFFRK